MSNSALATYINRTCGHYSARSSEALISKIMIHNAFEYGDRYDMTDLINSGSSSYHYGVSSDGVIGLYTDENRCAHGCKNSDINDKCIHILVLPEEPENGASSLTPTTLSTGLQSVLQKASSLSEQWRIHEDVLPVLIDLIEDICRRNFIRECKYDPRDRENSTILCHSWYDTSTTCPGKMSSYFSDIASSVSKKLKTARVATEAESLKAMSTITVGATYPYVVTPDYTAKDINYSELRNIGVVGTMLWAGALYDARREKRKSYANPNINRQVEDAKKHNMPWALYADVRSKTSDEARKECTELYYVISKHSPKLGIWLHLDFTDISDQSAKLILQIYYDKIVSWGLKGRCGIYATKPQADKIDWPNWADKFAFWWIAPLPNVSSLDSLLTPTLFQLR